jgi:hypothetical protein
MVVKRSFEEDQLTFLQLRLTRIESLMSLARFPPVRLISSSVNFSLLNTGADGGSVGSPRSWRVGKPSGGESVDDDDDVVVEVDFGSIVEGLDWEELYRHRAGGGVAEAHIALGGRILFRISMIDGLLRLAQRYSQ